MIINSARLELIQTEEHVRLYIFFKSFAARVPFYLTLCAILLKAGILVRIETVNHLKYDNVLRIDTTF